LFLLCVEQQSVESLPAVQSTEKKPRRLIYCSDGILEEYSTDEDEDKVDGIAEQPVNTVEMLLNILCI